MSGRGGGHAESVPQVMEAISSQARSHEVSVASFCRGSRLGAVQGQKEVNTQGVGQ